MFYQKKKGIGETISFTMITLLIIVSSLTSFIFAKKIYQDSLVKADTERMRDFLRKLDLSINEISNYDSSSKTLFIKFETGTLEFNESIAFYQSLFDYNGDEICFSSLCYYSINGYERSYINISSLSFDQNISVRPGSYQIYLEYDKANSKIKIQFK